MQEIVYNIYAVEISLQKSWTKPVIWESKAVKRKFALV